MRPGLAIQQDDFCLTIFLSAEGNMATRTDLANAIRALAMDAVEKAKSGHPGRPMGMAEISEVVWNHHMRHNPANPKWPDRDRFVLSNGHGSMLIYSLLHLTGYDVTIDDIKQFRQLHSRTPGHPEYGYTAGVETTTGPLGQGITNAVGMALAEKLLAAEFNKPGHDIVNHHTYVFMGDGCMMEGISHEACALAGTWKLNKLIAVWDDNGISIDGHTDGWFTEDVCGRFEAYGWNVVRNVDGHELRRPGSRHGQNAKASSRQAHPDPGQDHHRQGLPNKQGGHDCHGAPLGDKEIAAVRETIGWPHAPFEIPAGRLRRLERQDQGRGPGKTVEQQVRRICHAQFPAEAAEFTRRTEWRAAGRLG
jgi:transketolase